MQARAVRKKRNDAAGLKFCDVQWRFLRPATSVIAPPHDAATAFDAGFISRLQREHDVDADRGNNPRVLALLTGEAAQDDMLDSLMDELHALRQDRQHLPPLYDSVQHFISNCDPATPGTTTTSSISAVTHAKTVARKHTAKGRRRSSVHNPDDVAAAQASAKAAIQTALEQVQEDVAYVKPIESREDAPERPVTPNIVWRATDRVQVAMDIPSQLMPRSAPSKLRPHRPPASPSSSATSDKAKKVAYGAWYMPPQEWGRELKHGARRRSVDSLYDDDHAMEIRDQIPKLFIAREYREFILAKNAALPAYLDPSGEKTFDLTLDFFKHLVILHGGRDVVQDLSTYDVNHVHRHHPNANQYVKEATWFVSHAWSYKYLDVVDALTDFFDFEGLESDNIAVWFCMFNNNHHLVQEDTIVPFEYWVDSFQSAMKAIGMVVMVLSPWNNPTTLTRTWCAFEIYVAIKTEARFEVAMGKAQKVNAMATTSCSMATLAIRTYSWVTTPRPSVAHREKVAPVARALEGLSLQLALMHRWACISPANTRHTPRPPEGWSRAHDLWQRSGLRHGVI
ncbi:Aste57867_17184 [Aphanomyces stellatus]|uniref:Aste57867_17184 protein n=1 Tax=Aphanomyces stellatus TaxID=120398 RepID=A0A485L8V5_9STRA|nr:hypothetical protein As57867_017125 [Aphanomyces stellatus]VFT93941.1 Aste57867_17184 [Aphanomyces stellatus]